MPTPQFSRPNDSAGMDEIRNYLAMLWKELTYIMSKLDSKNIRAEGIEADRIKALSITAAQISAGTITADKMNVTELSAITANMGTLTAGSITSTASINVGTDATIGNNLNMGVSSYAGAKAITFSTDVGKVANISVTSGDLSIQTDGFITLTIGSSQGLVVNKVVAASALKSNTITNNSGVSVIFSGASTSSHIQGNHNHGIPDGTVLMVDGGGTVTFSASGGFTHSHTVS